MTRTSNDAGKSGEGVAGEMQALCLVGRALRPAAIAHRVCRVDSATCGVSRSRGTRCAAEYAVALKLPLKADLSFSVTDPVPAESLRLRAFPFPREGFCRCMQLLSGRSLRGSTEWGFLPCSSGPDVL